MAVLSYVAYVGSARRCIAPVRRHGDGATVDFAIDSSEELLATVLGRGDGGTVGELPARAERHVETVGLIDDGVAEEAPLIARRG
jgi:hypothetical protein